MISAAYINPTAYGDLSGANYLVWLITHLLADWKFITIFSMLFGAGIFLMTSRVEAAGRSSAALHYRRMGWLVLFGLIHSYVLWSGDILYTYGMCGLLVFLFRKLNPRPLFIVGLLMLAVPPAFFLATARQLAHAPAAELQAETQEGWKPTADMVNQELAAYRGSWIEQMSARAPFTFYIQTSFFLTFYFWRTTGCMLIGMGLFKLGVLSGKLLARVYWTLIAFAVLAGIPVLLYGTHRDFATGWNYIQSFYINIQYNYWASILISLAWVGLIILLLRTRSFIPLGKRLAAVGRMAFSNYILQTLICTTIFYGHGFGLFGKVSRVGQIGIVAAIWALQLIISPMWFQSFVFGPLEWLWRSLTYLRWEPFRRPLSA